MLTDETFTTWQKKTYGPLWFWNTWLEEHEYMHQLLRQEYTRQKTWEAVADFVINEVMR